MNLFVDMVLVRPLAAVVLLLATLHVSPVWGLVVAALLLLMAFLARNEN